MFQIFLSVAIVTRFQYSMLYTDLNGNHPQIIPVKFYSIWLSGMGGGEFRFMLIVDDGRTTDDDGRQTADKRAF